jgi:hypothetical protein
MSAQEEAHDAAPRTAREAKIKGEQSSNYTISEEENKH